MVGRTHDELHALSDHAVAADDELVAEDWVVEKNIALFELGRIVCVVVVGEVADFDVGRLDDVFKKTRRTVFVGDDSVGIRIDRGHGHLHFL